MKLYLRLSRLRLTYDKYGNSIGARTTDALILSARKMIDKSESPNPNWTENELNWIKTLDRDDTRGGNNNL